MNHYPRLAGHPAEGIMYDTSPREVYFPHKQNDLDSTVNACRKCTRNRSNKTGTRHLKRLPVRGLLEFTAMDILSPYSRDKKQELIRSNHDQSIFQAHMNTANLENNHDACCNHLICQQDRIVRDSCLQLTDNGTQIVSEFFGTICNFLGLRNLQTTAYHPQTNGEAE